MKLKFLNNFFILIGFLILGCAHQPNMKSGSGLTISSDPPGALIGLIKADRSGMYPEKGYSFKWKTAPARYGSEDLTFHTDVSLFYPEKLKCWLIIAFKDGDAKNKFIQYGGRHTQDQINFQIASSADKRITVGGSRGPIPESLNIVFD